MKNSMQLDTPEESASFGETARRAKRAPSASRACMDMIGAAVQCWSLQRSVPKLIKSKARFPFFVRQVTGALPVLCQAGFEFGGFSP